MNNLLMQIIKRMDHHTSELIIGMGDLSGRAGRNVDEFQGVHGGISNCEKNQEERMLLECCDAKHLCIANTWLRKADKKKITYGSGCNESEIEFYVMGKVDRKFLKNFQVISGMSQYNPIGS